MDNVINNLLKNQLNKDYLILEDYFNKIEKQFNVNINIHDVIGIAAVNSAISIAVSSHSYHNNSFCNFVKKDSKALRNCILSKEKLCKKCQSNREPFYGKCYMGVEELVYPVFSKDKLIAVLCIGQFYSDEKRSKNTIVKKAERYSLSNKELEGLYFSSVKKVNESAISEIITFVEIAVKYITLLFEESLRNNLKIDSSIDRLDTYNTYKNNFIISNTVDFIKKNYKEQLSLDILASNSYCNATYLSSLFKEKMNIGVSEYINFIRVQAAKELLNITVKPITEIAFLVGFNDGAYFSRVFKGIEAITPKEYREKIST